MALTVIKEALVRIAGPAENESFLQGKSSKGEQTRQYFCIEDTLLSKDIDVSVEGIGKLSFPLSNEIIENMINVSSKAEFGRGEDTVLDISVRDTQVISAKHLEVKINADSLSDILEKMCSGLNLGRNASLVPHLYNFLIYGPGQFFKMHRDSEKMKNMVATLVILLPSVHKGGELVIEHNNQKHVFLRSKYPEIIKCVMFYSDCQHEIKEITEGYRIVLTYNVVLEETHLSVNETPIDEELDNALLEYFDSDEEPEKLVYFLNHSYSEHSLKWGLLKGTDRTSAMALLAVAKHQDRIPCLALADHTESYNVERRYYGDSGSESDLIESSTNLYFWVNENSIPFKEKKTDVSEDEMCYTYETKDICEPYQTEESEPIGNEGETRDHWYRRACVVLWANKWCCSTGFKDATIYLHSLTTSEGNEARIQSEIDNAGSNFYNNHIWENAGVCDKWVDIVKYLNDGEKAIAILPKLLPELLQCDKMDNLLELERQTDSETWVKVFNADKKELNFQSTLKFIETYVKRVDLSKSKVICLLLEDCLDKFCKSTQQRSWQYFYTENKIDTAVASHTLIGIVYDVVNRINDNEKAIAILSKLSPELLKSGMVDNFLKLEKQFDNETWVKIFDAWKKPLNWISSSTFIQAYAKQADVSNSKFIGLLLEDCVDGFLKNSESAHSYHYQKDIQNSADNCEALIDIVKYVNDSNKVVTILSELSSVLLLSDKVNIFLELEKHIVKETWVQIVNAWKPSLNWKSTSNFIEVYVKQPGASESKVAGLLLEGCVDDFMKSVINPFNSKNQIKSIKYVYDRTTTDKKTINDICKMLALCSVSNNQFLENKIIQHMTSKSTVFSSQHLAEIYFTLKQNRPNDCERYKTLCNTALLRVQRDLIDQRSLGDSWYWAIDIPCSCQFCEKVKSFFHSKTVNKVVIPASVQNRKHLYKFLNLLKNYPVQFDTLKSGSPHKVVIEKSEKLLKDRQSYITSLTNIEKKLLANTRLADKDVGPAISSTNDKTLMEDNPPPTKRMKM